MGESVLWQSRYFMHAIFLPSLNFKLVVFEISILSLLSVQLEGVGVRPTGKVMTLLSQYFQENFKEIFLEEKGKERKKFKGFSILLFNVKLPFCFPFFSHWNFRYFPRIFLISMRLSLVIFPGKYQFNVKVTFWS